MKDFFRKLMSSDENGKNFTKKEMVWYGIVVPVAFFVIMGIAGWLETSCA